MITKIISTAAIVLGLVAILMIRRQREKTGSVRWEKTGEESFRIVLVSVSRLIAYTAYGVAAVVFLCAALEEKKGDLFYGMALGAIFLCAGTYWILRCFRWRVEISDGGISCRGTLGGARKIVWKEVREAKMLYENVKTTKEVSVRLEYGEGKLLRFSVPEQYAGEVKKLIKKHSKISVRS